MLHSGVLRTKGTEQKTFGFPADEEAVVFGDPAMAGSAVAAMAAKTVAMSFVFMSMLFLMGFAVWF